MAQEKHALKMMMISGSDDDEDTRMDSGCHAYLHFPAMSQQVYGSNIPGTCGHWPALFETCGCMRSCNGYQAAC